MSLWRSYKPTIAKVNGIAVGGGSDIALCCDLVIMENDAKIGYPPSRIWGCPTTAMWVYRLGAEKAKRMLFTGIPFLFLILFFNSLFNLFQFYYYIHLVLISQSKTNPLSHFIVLFCFVYWIFILGDLITGVEAVQLGLCLESVPKENLSKRVIEIANRIAGIPRNQLMLQKLMINQAYENMGISNTQLIATLFDGIARHSPEGNWFKQVCEQNGWKYAVQKRDSGEHLAVNVSKPWSKL